MVQLYVPELAVEAVTKFHVNPPSYEASIFIAFTTLVFVQVIGTVLQPIKTFPPFRLVNVSVGFTI